MKKYQNKILLSLSVLAVLAVAFWWDGNGTGLQGMDFLSKAPAFQGENKPVKPQEPPATLMPEEILPSSTPAPKAEKKEEPSLIPQSEKKQENSITPSEAPLENKAQQETLSPKENTSRVSRLQGMNASEGETDVYQTSPVPEGKPGPVEPQNTVITKKALTCTFRISCEPLLKNLDRLSSEKKGLVPTNGVIIPSQTVTFYEGESVFHLLLRETKKNKIHMEYENPPFYNSAYIEGIHNLYEFDCGELSGWMYRVNGWVPNYGSSRYQLKEGDVVEWIFTCDLGNDVED